MPIISVPLTHPTYSSKLLLQSVNEIFAATRLFSLSTVNKDTPFNCVMFLAYDSGLCLFFFSEPRTQHVQNILANGRVAGVVADSRQTWEHPRRGIQFGGTARAVEPSETEHVVDLYHRRYPGFRRWKKTEPSGEELPVSVRPFVIRPRWIKLFDEKLIGHETWIQLELPPRCL